MAYPLLFFEGKGDLLKSNIDPGSIYYENIHAVHSISQDFSSLLYLNSLKTPTVQTDYKIFFLYLLTEKTESLRS